MAKIGISVTLDEETGVQVDKLIKKFEPKYSSRAHLIAIAVKDLFMKEKGE